MAHLFGARSCFAFMHILQAQTICHISVKIMLLCCMYVVDGGCMQIW